MRDSGSSRLAERLLKNRERIASRAERIGVDWPDGT